MTDKSDKAYKTIGEVTPPDIVLNKLEPLYIKCVSMTFDCTAHSPSQFNKPKHT